jgi:hypothetical protein
VRPIHAGQVRRVWDTTDPDGRRVVLPPERWLHIVGAHEELADERREILLGVAIPAYRAAAEGRARSGSYTTRKVRAGS